jgi:hypothetical protein
MSPDEIQRSKDKIDKELKYMQLVNKHDTEMKNKVIIIISFTIFGFIAGLIIGRIL